MVNKTNYPNSYKEGVNMNQAIKVKHLSASYYGNEVLKDISFEFSKGKIVGIVGPNGAGKSTMIKAILGLIPKDKGDVEIDGESIHKARKRVAYVPQRNDLDWDFPINVLDTVILGTYPRLGLLKKPGKKEKEKALRALEKVGMTEFQKRQIGELSGGQQQRIFLARALVQDADLFFLDEPFVGIDNKSETTIMEILNELKSLGKTIFVVHHDLSKVETYFDELILLNKEIIETGKVEKVFVEENIARAYESQFSFLKPMKVGA